MWPLVPRRETANASPEPRCLLQDIDNLSHPNLAVSVHVYSDIAIGTFEPHRDLKSPDCVSKTCIAVPIQIAKSHRLPSADRPNIGGTSLIEAAVHAVLEVHGPGSVHLGDMGSRRIVTGRYGIREISRIDCRILPCKVHNGIQLLRVSVCSLEVLW